MYVGLCVVKMEGAELAGLLAGRKQICDMR